MGTLTKNGSGNKTTVNQKKNQQTQQQGTAKKGGSLTRISTGEVFHAGEQKTSTPVKTYYSTSKTAAKTTTSAQTSKKQPVDLWQTRTITDRETQPSVKQRLNSVNERMKNATINGDTDTLLALRPEQKNLESQVYKKGAKKEYTAEQKTALKNLKKRQTEAISLGKTEDVAKLQRQMMDIRSENNRQTLGDRALNTTASILEGSLGQTTNAVGTGADVLRSVVNGIDVHNADYNRRQIAYIRKALADGKTSDGSVLTDAQRKAMQQRIQTMQEEIDRWGSPDSTVYKVHHALDKPVSALYQAADEMVSDSANQKEYAKKNLGAVGSTLVDAAISTGQSYLTNVTGAVTGTGYLPFVVQAFGGATQEARNGGADLTHQVGYGTAEAAKEYITEKMSGLTLPQRLLGKAGAGTFDSMLEKGIRNVTDRLASTPGGQKVLGGLISWLASGATEGAEEIVGDAIENTLINPTLRKWDPDTRTTQEKFEDALYDGLVGGLSGMIGGVNQLVGYQPSGNAYNVQNGVQGENNANETMPGTTEEISAAAPGETVTQEQQAQVDAIMAALERQRQNYDNLTEEEQNAVNQGYEAGTIGMDASNSVFRVDPDQHIDRRTMGSVKGANVNAFQYDHPELHGYLEKAAQDIMADAETSLQYPMSRSYERTMQGNRVKQSAETSPVLRMAMDETGMSRNDIIDSAQKIIHDQGEENTVKAKRLELVLNDMLSNGYTTMSGDTVSPDQSYLERKAGISGAVTEGNTESSALPIWDMAETAPEEIALNQEQVRRAANTLGENGAKALTNAYDSATAAQISPEDAVRTFYQVYHSAMTGKKMNAADAQNAAKMPPHFIQAAENSAQRDAAKAKQAQYFGDRAQLVKDDLWKKAHLSSRTNRTLDALAKTLGVEIRFAETVENGQANAQYKDGVITVALDAQDPILTTVTHEAVHRIREISPESYRALSSFLESSMSEKGMEFNLGVREQLYGTDDSNMLTEETVADAFGRLLGDEKTLNQFVTDNRTAAQKFADVLRDIVNSIQRALHHQNLGLSENQRKAFSDLEGKVSEMERLFADALDKAAENKNTATEGGETQTVNGIQYSMKMNFEDQVDAVLNRELDRNSSVYVMDTPEMLQSLGLKDYPMLMTQRHILDIVHDKSGKNAHWHGISSNMVKQLPSMIKNPVMILESATKHGDAVIITSKLDNEGLPVVVSIHPDGSGQYNKAEIASNFITSMYGKDGFEGFISSAINDGRVLYNNKNRTRTLFANAGLQLPGSLLRDGFFKSTISQPLETVKGKFSLKTDSTGRELTEAQQEYFKDSKVVDADGKLKVMYRGGNGDFTVFDRKKSSYSNLYGRGFYFTDSEAHARQYGNAREFYLNITNPVSTTETTITRTQMRKFLKAVAANEDDFSFENYGYDATVDSVLKSVYGKSDFAMLYDVNQTAIGDMVAAVELFNEVNETDYDGLILDTETVAFRSDQIKNTDNKNPTTDPDIRFSMKTPVEETDKLIAVHNKDEDSILSALKLVGLPMPSIAVVKAKSGHSKYGPISLLFNKSTIDPQVDSRNKVYGGDAYTPTNPGVEYPVNATAARKAENAIYDLSKNVADGIFANSSVLGRHGIEDVSRNSLLKTAENLANDDTVRAAYLAAQGKTLEPVYQEKVWDSKVGNDVLKTIVDKIGVQQLAEINANFELGESSETALGESADFLRNIMREHYRELGEPLLQKMAKKRGWSPEEISEKRNARIERSMENVTPFTLENLARHAWEMYQDGGATAGEIDRMETREKLRELTDGEDVKGWVEKQLDGVLGEPGIYNGKDPYTSAGNRRSFDETHYTYTLENIVRAMQETQEERGGQVSGVTAGGLQASSVPSYRTIQEIRDDSGRLGSVETDSYKAQMEGVEAKIQSVTQRIMQTTEAHSDNSFEEGEIIGDVLMEAAKGKRTIDSIMRTFAKEDYKISNVTAKQIQELYRAAAALPTEYFEAKPQRAVGFDEVLAAVIPDNSSERLKNALRDAGVNMVEYAAGDEADRLAKVNSVNDAQFSRKGSDVLDEYVRQHGEIQSGTRAYSQLDGTRTARGDGWNGLGNADAGTLNSSFDDMQAKADEFHPVNRNSSERIMKEQNRAPSDVPKVNPDTGKNITKTVSTILNSPLTSKEMAPIYENAIADGQFDYEKIGDRDAAKLSQERIRRDGYESVAQGVLARFQLGQHMTKYDMADAISAYNSAVSDGNNQLAYELSLAVSGSAHDSAQVVQAMNLMNRLTPEGKLLTLRRYVDQLNDRQAKKSTPKKSRRKGQENVDAARENYVEQVTGFTISDDLAANYLMAETDAERKAAWEAITQNIADQMPSTFREKANFWRYTMMLTNPTTHVRNVVGNAIQDGARHVKNGVGTMLERAVLRDRTQRTKSVLVGKEGKALKEFARAQYTDDQNAAMGAGKYSDGSAAGIQREIESKRKMFKGKNPVSKAVQGMGDLNSRVLDVEDLLFNRSAYVDSFAQALKAKGVTAEEAANGQKADLVESARSYAISEAQKATYRNTTALSEAISGLGRYDGPNIVKKAGSFAADAILPFRRTPANILTTGIDYSPAGLMKAITYDAVQVKKGNMSAADMVDHLSAGLSGSAIMVLGAYLAAEGLLHVKPGDDDKEEAFNKATGMQDYSLEIGDGSYTLDWAVPAAMALFAGASVMESVGNGGGTFSALVDAMTGTSDVVLETSMLSSLNDMLSSVSYADNIPTYIIDRVLTSYAGQYVPTLGGKVASIFDDTVRKSYVEKGTGQVASDVDYFQQSIMKKIPGMRNQLQPSIDLWGNEIFNGSVGGRVAQNLISPGYWKKIDTDPVTVEVRRLAKASGESGVYPAAAEKKITFKDENDLSVERNLTAEEYTQYAKILGQTRYQSLKSLFSSREYKKLSDAEKADAVSNVYTMAKRVAAAEITGSDTDGWILKAQEAQKKYGIDPGTYSMLRAQISGLESWKDKNGDTIQNSKGYQIMQVVNDSGLTEKQKNAMYEYLGVPKGIRHMNKAAVKEQLERMKKRTAK